MKDKDKAKTIYLNSNIYPQNKIHVDKTRKKEKASVAIYTSGTNERTTFSFLNYTRREWRMEWDGMENEWFCVRQGADMKITGKLLGSREERL